MTAVAHPAQADLDRRSPGRPRSVRADEAIVDAVLNLLAEGHSMEALSIEAIAARAGVGKATIYRRWTNKEALIVDAVTTLKGEPPELTGASIRDDLVALLGPVGRDTGERNGQVVSCLMSELRRSPQLQRSFQKIVEPRRALMRQVLQRGIHSGELRPDLDIEIIMAMLVGPVLTQRVFAWNPALETADLPQRLVDAIMPAISHPTPPTAVRRPARR